MSYTWPPIFTLKMSEDYPSIIVEKERDRVLATPRAVHAKTIKPNILIILVDDMTSSMRPAVARELTRAEPIQRQPT